MRIRDSDAVIHPTIPEQFDAFGLSKVKDLLALELRAEECPGQLDTLACKLLLRGRVTVRPVNLRRWDQELAFVRHCYNEAWADNWGFGRGPIASSRCWPSR